MIGERIAHYEITGKLGEGGMGEVYRATDTKLNREVALKIVPEQFAADSQRMGRFQREAEVLASLDHPNIGAIHGIEEYGSTRALVLQLIEGPTLADRIKQGPLPQDEALSIALQVAEALESAHEQGIIHRDLKPANIKLTPEGQVKVLDFGLAKAMETEITSSPDLSKSPTLSMAATQAGMILGTAGYMAPEQTRGLAADRRVDIWAFGVVFYEMLTGRKAFEGEDLSMVMAAVMMKEPEWENLPTGLPKPIEELIERCLRKDPNLRVQSIGDVRIGIQEYLADPTPAVEQDAAVVAPGGSRGPLLLASGLLAGLVVGAAALWALTPEAAAPKPLRLSVAMTKDEPLQTDQGASNVLSPDGRRVAYATGTTDAQSGRLYIRSLDQLEGEFLAGTEAAYNPFFSPDGQWLGFVTPTQIKKVSISGGTPLELCSVNLSRGASWGSGGLIAFAAGPASGLMLVSEAGGEPTPLTTLEEGENSHRWPSFLPGGTHVIFSVYGAGDRNTGRVEAVEVATGKRTVIHQGGTFARYSSSGHLLYVNNNTVFAAPLELPSLQLTALPAPVLHEVSTNPEGGSQYDIAENGTLIYLTGSAEGAKRRIAWSDFDGELTDISETQLDYQSPRLSPDERTLAIEIMQEGNPDIWLFDLERGAQTRLTFDAGIDRGPVWSPDGLDVYFGSNRSGKFGIFRKKADGSGAAEVLIESDSQMFPYSVSPDGRATRFLRGPSRHQL